MLPIGVITWRLGVSSIDNLEQLVPPKEMRDTILTKLSQNYEGIYFMNSCQRIIIVAGVDNKLLLDNLKLEYFNLLGIENDAGSEIYTGPVALRHLGEVISSIDSITLGEDQIHHQFKTAFEECRPYMGSTLKFIIQKIIRLGKRIRNLDIFNQGRISTISMVTNIYGKEIEKASSIGLIGTGKMGRGIVRIVKEYNSEINVYSRSGAREETIDSYAIEDFINIKDHDVLLLATDAKKPIITKQFINDYSIKPNYIFDLSMPRNCHEDVATIDKISVISLSDLLTHSKNSFDNNEINEVFEFLSIEIRKIIVEYVKYAQSKIFVALREDMQSLAENNKDLIISGDDKAERQYDLLVKKLIHISQTHIETLLKGAN